MKQPEFEPHEKRFTQFDRGFLKSLRISLEEPPKQVHHAHCQGDGCDCGDTSHSERTKE